MSTIAAAFHEDQQHLTFVATGVALAIAGGFALAVALPIDAALGFSLGPRWLQLAQAHGHLQSVGFVGMVIMGVALRVGPRFAGQRIRRPRLIGIAFGAILAAVILRAGGQALADYRPFETLMAIGAWLEVVAAAAFGWAIIESSSKAIRRGSAPSIFLAAGCSWFLIQALLGAIWITDAASEGRPVLPFDRNGVLLFLQFFGFHLMFILGVGLQALPTFFGRRAPPTRLALTAFVVMQTGIVVTAAALAWFAFGGERVSQLENAGLVVLSAGLLGTVFLTGARGAPVRLRPATQPIGRLPQAAMTWLAVTSGLLMFFAVRALADGRGLLLAESDAVRHLLGLGVVTIAIIGMAHIVLPEFAVERLRGRSGRRRAWLFGIGFSLAAALRAAPGIAGTGLPSSGDYWHMAAAGIISFGLIAWFGWLLWRAVREQPILLQEVAAVASGTR